MPVTRSSFSLAALLAVAMLTLAACASTQSGSSYGQHEAREEMTVRMGVVESVRNVTLEGSKSGAGAVAGGVVGGIAGSNVGQGKGSDIGAVLGAVVGGILGNTIEENATKKGGIEITVKLDDGKLVAVVQEADEAFHPGERVRLLSRGGRTRVSH